MKKLNIKNWLLLLVILFSFCKPPKIKYDETIEARGIWVTRWEWAQHANLNNPPAQQNRIAEIFDVIKQAKLNFVLFQIRGNADAFYRSPYEPWSKLLTGELGKDPGWDPLSFAIEQAHQRGLELHAWVNTFTVWSDTSPPPHTIPEHLFHAHPEWIICDKNGTPMPLNAHYINLSPGIPAARDFVHNVCLDIVRAYDIDGLHFDYIRYPENSPDKGYSQDPISLRLFNSPEGNPQNLAWEDWQRENINLFVRKFYDEAIQIKPWLKISAAVIGKYNYSLWNGFHIVYQDAMQWIKEQKVDFIVPMIYWQTNHATAPFGSVVADWLISRQRTRYIFPGSAINQLGSEKWPLDEVAKQTKITRQCGANGLVFFSYSGLEKVRAQLENYGFQHVANFPPMMWKAKQPPLDPILIAADYYHPGGILLKWLPPDSTLEPATIYRYSIYRSEKSPVDLCQAENLIHITAGPVPFFLDTSVKNDHTYYYVVTALDRANNQSPPSNEIKVSIPTFVAIADQKNVANNTILE